MLSLGEMQSGRRFFEPNHTRPPLVGIGVLADLRHFIGKPRHNAPLIDATNLQGDFLFRSFPNIRK
jgi:hypothetical protein